MEHNISPVCRLLLVSIDLRRQARPRRPLESIHLILSIDPLYQPELRGTWVFRELKPGVTPVSVEALVSKIYLKYVTESVWGTRYIMDPIQANSAFHPSGVGKWVVIHVNTWITDYGGKAPFNGRPEQLRIAVWSQVKARGCGLRLRDQSIIFVIGASTNTKLKFSVLSSHCSSSALIGRRHVKRLRASTERVK